MKLLMFRMSSFVFLLDVSLETNKSDAGSRSLCFSSVCRFILIYFSRTFVLWLHLEFLSYINVSSCFIWTQQPLLRPLFLFPCVLVLCCVCLCADRPQRSFSISCRRRFRLSNAPSVALTLKWALPASFQSSSTQIGPIKSRLLQSGSSSEQISLRL